MGKSVADGTLPVFAHLRLRSLTVGWPRQVKDALALRPRPDVVFAPRLSPGARSILDNEEVGWLDETGAASIAVSALVISRTGDLVLASDSSLGWRPATLTVCESLLTGTAATVSAVVDATGLAQSTAATALSFLQDQGLLVGDVKRGRGAGRRLDDPDELLDAYAAAAERLRTPIRLTAGILWRDPLTSLEKTGALWDAAGIRWAATSALTAALLAPFQTEVAPLEVYIEASTPGDLRVAAKEAGLKDIEGGRLVLRPFPSPGAPAIDRVQGVNTVPWVRAYADLRTSGVRGETVADELRYQMSIHRQRLPT